MSRTTPRPATLRLPALLLTLGIAPATHAAPVAGNWTFADMERPYFGSGESHDSISAWVGTTGSGSQAILSRPVGSGRYAHLEFHLEGSGYPGAGVSFRSPSELPVDLRRAGAISFRVRGDLPAVATSVRVSLYSPHGGYLSLNGHGGNLGTQVEGSVHPEAWTQVVVPLARMTAPSWDRAEVFELESLRDSVLGSVALVAVWINGADSIADATGFLDIDDIQFLSTTAPLPPPGAILGLPRDGTIRNAWSALTWIAPLEAGKTRLQISADPTFATTLVDTTRLVWGGGPYRILTPAPPQAGIYHWRVATTSEGGTTWSESRTIDWRTDPSDTLWKRQSILFPRLPAHALGDPPFDPGAVASSGLPVVYTSSDTTVARITGGLVAIVGTGRVVLTASQPGDADHSPAEPRRESLQVTPVGSGTVEAPYLVRSIGDLAWIADHPETWHAVFRQTADVDARGSGSGDFRIHPIGTREAPFAGSFDGSGRKISNLHVQDGVGPTGLFGAIERASLSGIHLVDDTILGGDTTGALAGMAWTSTITDCSTDGIVRGTGDVGGLVGVADRTEIVFCRSRGTVAATRSCAGGLVARAVSGGISSSTSSADVSNSAASSGVESTGGLVGTSSGPVSRSYSTGDVLASGHWVGGLVGNSVAGGSITDCYSTGSVNGGDIVGGIAGAAVSVSDCYAIGRVVAGSGSKVGALAGYLALDHGLEACVWDTTSTGQENPLGTGSAPIGLGALARSRQAMSRPELYTGIGWRRNPWAFPLDGLPYLDLTAFGFLPDTLRMTVGDPDYVADTSWNRGSIYLVSSDPAVARVGRASIHPLAPGRTRIRILHDVGDGPTGSDSCWLTVEPMQQFLDFPPLSIRTVGDPDFAPKAIASRGGPVEFESSDPDVATVVAGKVHLVGPGLAILRAIQAGGGAIAPTSAERTLRVIPYGAPAGSGTIADPFLISSYEDLRWLALDSLAWKSHLVQTSDIDAQTSRSGGEGLPGIGSRSAPFDGTYEGTGHAIRHSLSRSLQPSNLDPQGLFSVVGTSGQVRHLVLEDAQSYGADNGAGALVGSNMGLVDSCVVDADVVSGGRAGGLAAENRGTIRRSVATGIVDLLPSSGKPLGGGLVGSNWGVVEDCYSTAIIRSKTPVFGLAGANAGRIRRCYAFCGESPMCGGVAPGDVDSSFWNRDFLVPHEESPPFLSAKMMTDSVYLSVVVGGSGNWLARWGKAPPRLSGIDNPPWANTDTLAASDTFRLTRLLANDGFAEEERAHLAIHLDSLSPAGTTDSTTRIVLPKADTTNDPVGIRGPYRLYYRVGRIRPGGDTLWGNSVRSDLRRSLPPVLTFPTIRLDEDSIHRGSIASDRDGDPLEVAVIAKPLLGQATFQRDTLVYVPHSDVHGWDSLEVVVSDGTDSLQGWVRISIRSVNDPPLAMDRFDSIDASGTDSFALAATDIDGTVEAFHVVDQPRHGMVRLSSRRLTYFPDPGFVGLDTLRWVAVDDSGTSSRAALWVFRVVGATSAIVPRTSPSPSDGRIRVLRGLVQPAGFRDAARLDDRSSVCRAEAPCASIRIAIARPSRVRISIHDNAGVPVLSREWTVTSTELSSLPHARDGKRLLDLGWNLRATNGEPVADGVYLWTVEVVGDEGEPWRKHLRTGVVSSP